MYFESLAAALAMDGHGAFVWSAYLITLVVVVFMLYLPRHREKQILRRLEGQHRRDSRAAPPPTRSSDASGS
ncbi:heme exporter protein CcmD [Kineobactrum salinum]|uniref:Heme exporter protein D n=1 Tax=Kineobactrum salinum TaxID=2708301 RepID=A0A6C0U0A6_9GAMM|nr:heme exporter protein CcmD [Kineobactrum salinum]QIB64407.1 heme exporter protein CcmD [Kineobactrum salinum]